MLRAPWVKEGRGRRGSPAVEAEAARESSAAARALLAVAASIISVVVCVGLGMRPVNGRVGFADARQAGRRDAHDDAVSRRSSFRLIVSSRYKPGGTQTTRVQ